MDAARSDHDQVGAIGGRHQRRSGRATANQVGVHRDLRVAGDAVGELRGHQVRLEGGDASSDSYCYS